MRFTGFISQETKPGISLLLFQKKKIAQSIFSPLDANPTNKIHLPILYYAFGLL
uniref:Uncharacterized protein n=1 Tax=Arundo donax TaxID=35708 RepID=A0A0A9A2F1_ARUDO